MLKQRAGELILGEGYVVVHNGCPAPDGFEFDDLRVMRMDFNPRKMG